MRNLIENESSAHDDSVIEDINRDFEKECENKSVEKLKTLLAKAQSFPSMRDDKMDAKIEIIKRVLAKKEANQS